jgi:hypothetical protein
MSRRMKREGRRGWKETKDMRRRQERYKTTSSKPWYLVGTELEEGIGISKIANRRDRVEG